MPGSRPKLSRSFVILLLIAALVVFIMLALVFAQAYL